jgi:uncharacterized membrane-anchored protein
MKIIAAQGELRVYKINTLPQGIGNTRPKKNANGAYILAHSEKGHHHVIGGDVDVIENVTTQSIGAQSLAMRTLYAIVREPTMLHQTATNGHLDVLLEPGIYEIRADVEFDPFAEEIRQVHD